MSSAQLHMRAVLTKNVPDVLYRPLQYGTYAESYEPAYVFRGPKSAERLAHSVPRYEEYMSGLLVCYGYSMPKVSRHYTCLNLEHACRLLSTSHFNILYGVRIVEYESTYRTKLMVRTCLISKLGAWRSAAVRVRTVCASQYWRHWRQIPMVTNAARRLPVIRTGGSL